MPKRLRFNLHRSVLLVSCIALSSCGALENGMVGAGGHGVTAPSLLIDSRFDALKDDRVKVAAIQIAAPKENTRVWRGDLIIRTRDRYGPVSTRRSSATYYLDNDMNTGVREALSYFFEIDPDADPALDVTVKLRTRARYDDDESCEWATQLEMDMLLVYQWSDNMKIRKRYDTKLSERLCAGFQHFPSLSKVEDLLARGLTDLFVQLADSRVE